MQRQELPGACAQQQQVGVAGVQGAAGQRGASESPHAQEAAAGHLPKAGGTDAGAAEQRGGIQGPVQVSDAALMPLKNLPNSVRGKLWWALLA